MPKDQQSRQPETVAAKRGKPRLLPRAAQRASGSALAAREHFTGCHLMENGAATFAIHRRW